MGLGYIARGVADGDNIVGDDRGRGYGKRARMVWIWIAMGFRADDQSIAGQPVAGAAGMGRASRVPTRAIAPEPPPAGVRNRGAVLRAMDGAKLFGVPPIHSTAFQHPF